MSAPEGIYRRVSVRLWGDEKVRKLTPLQPSGQALWLYLLTGPHTGAIPGVFVAGRAAIAEALEWEIEDFDRCVKELTDLGIVRFDRPTRMWFIPKAINHNPPANPNVVIGWRGAWSLLPEGAMRDEVAAALRAGLKGISDAFVEAFDKGTGNPSPKASSKPLAKTPRKQETGSRKQEAGEQEAGEEGPRKRDLPLAAPPDVDGQVWADWLQLRKAKRAPVTATTLEGARAEAAKAGLSLDAFLRIWCARGSQGLQASWLKDSERSAHASGDGGLASLTAGVQRRLGIGSQGKSESFDMVDYSAEARP